MADNKRQHFVPQFYLRRFSNDGRRINIFNIQREKTIIGGKLRSQCFRDYLYGKDLSFEKHLGEIEKRAALIIKRIDETGFFPAPKSEEWADLMLFIVTQYSRTLGAISDLDHLFDSVMKEMVSRSPRLRDFDQSKFTVTMKNSSQLSASLGGSTLPLASDLSFKLLHCPIPDAFVVSDNPVVYYNQLLEDNSFISHCGITSKGLLIFFPLSSKRIICFYDDKVYNVG
jgi:hypothetical protein